MTDKQRAWIAATTKTLQKKGSWTGRTHLHKQLFILSILKLADVPFEFELYHYGPYSFALDEVVANMEVFGDLDKEFRRAGYGPSYQITEDGEKYLAELSAHELKSTQKVATAIAAFDSADLELIATCLWVEVREKEKDSDAVVPRVREIKPKYNSSRIRWALSQANQLRKHLVT